MLFNSIYYFFFLILAVPIYWTVLSNKKKAREVFFIITGLALYAELNAYLSALLLFTASIDFFVVRAMVKPNTRNKKGLLLLSALINFAPLVAYKLFANELQIFSGTVTLISIPIGLSFYTFKSVGCIIDFYRRPQKVPPSYREFLFFVSYFPALLCGPISRIDQFSKNFDTQNYSFNSIKSGTNLILVGLFKKLCIADGVYYLIHDSTFSQPNLGHLTSQLIIALQLLQIYFDFSGYTDLARGIGKLFGHTLPENFNRSLIQSNIGEFWRRHHISMTEWFRDYLYLPMIKLGIIKNNPTATVCIAAILTFFVSGLWHKFDLNGSIFGISQGLLISAYSIYRLRKKVQFPKILCWIGTYQLIALSTFFVLSPSQDFLSRVLTGLTHWEPPQHYDIKFATVFFILIGIQYLQALDSFQGLKNRLRNIPSLLGFYWCCLMISIILFAPDQIQFIYYKF